MHRIDAPGATVDNRFTEGNPQSGVVATQVGSDWLNAVQEEIVGVILGAGDTLNKASNAQLLAAINKLIRVAAPVATVIQGYFAAAPSGYLELAGQLVSRTTYADLYAHANTNGLIVAEATWSASDWGKFGAGDGTTTFRLPDLRGEFVRGWDHGRGVDATRALATRQADELKSHTHTFSAGNGSGAAAWPDMNPPDGNPDNLQTCTTNATGGAETRPRNVALMYCIKF